MAGIGFWVAGGAMASVAALAMLRPLIGAARVPLPDQPESPEVAVYRAQLAEVERDLARGTLAPAEAERIRTEVGRRLLAADRLAAPMQAPAPGRPAGLAMAGALALVVGGGLGAYGWLGAPDRPEVTRADRLAQSQELRAARPSQAEAEAQAKIDFPAPPTPDDPQLTQMMEQLRAIVPTRPDDVTGWTLLADNEARLGRYAEAAVAQARVAALAPGVEAQARLVDLLVAAAGGVVTPEGEAALVELYRLAPEDPATLYYGGLLQAQVGRPDQAFPLWSRLLEVAEPDSFYVGLAEPGMPALAAMAGTDWEPVARGPSEADIAAAADMNAEDRQAMIQSMVAGLEGRLAEQGGPPEDWARLVTSLGVLGEADRAAAILAEARQTFAGDDAAQALLDGAEAALAAAP